MAYDVEAPDEQSASVMATYTFVPNSSTTEVNWSNTAIWAGGAIPDDPSADVVIPKTTYVSSGQPYYSFITASNDYSVASLSITDNYLTIDNGARLTISGALNVATGGEVDMGAGALGSGNLIVGSCDNDGLDVAGQGTLNCAGLFINRSVLAGSGLSATAARFENAGALEAGAGGLTLTVAPGGFSNLSNATLIGGNYIADGGVLSLNIGGVITTDAGYISLQAGGDIRSYDSAQAAYAPIETTLQTVAPAGILDVEDGAASWSTPLQVAGLLRLEQGDLSTPQLTLDKGAQLLGLGEASGPIVDDGTIVVGLTQNLDSSNAPGGVLELSGPVAGTGTAVITQGREEWLGSSASYAPWTLQLDGAASLNVQFSATDGLLVLKDPSGYTGTITPVGAGDQIELPGVGLSSVTGYSYADDSAGGTLTIDVAGSKIALKFAGDLDTQDFSLAAGPQTLSTDPPSLMITVGDTATAASTAAPDEARDNFVLSGFSQILISDPNGDVVAGWVNGGPIDNYQETYQRIAGLGPEWTFRGDGDFMGDGHSDFLIQNTNGALVVGEYDNGAVKYTALPIGLGPDWTFHGAGDFLGLGHDQILIEQTGGAVDLYDPQGGAQAVTRIGGLGAQWTFVGTGDFLGGSLSQFLIENSAGAVVMAEVEKGVASYTQIGGLGSEWKFVDVGDFLDDGKDQFLVRNSAGEVVAGEVGTGDKVQYVALGVVGPEWTFEGSGDYLGEGHDQFVIENKNGAVVIGDYVGGQLHYTQVGALGPQWTFHD